MLYRCKLFLLTHSSSPKFSPSFGHLHLPEHTPNLLSCDDVSCPLQDINIEAFGAMVDSSIINSGEPGSSHQSQLMEAVIERLGESLTSYIRSGADPSGANKSWEVRNNNLFLCDMTIGYEEMVL